MLHHPRRRLSQTQLATCRQARQDEAGPGNTIAISCNNADKVHQTDIQLAHSSRPAAPLIVCSCNVLSDHEIRDVVTAAGSQSLTAHQVYGCLGCRMQCGCCARAIKRILNEALADCAGGCAIVVGRPSHGKTPCTLKPAAPSNRSTSLRPGL